MICIYCGYDADTYDICPNCGRDLRLYKRIMTAGYICYNEGLRKAKARDLSGAVKELKQSLKFDKYNIEARNLLGLVYFEMGEPVNALAEWVISKNFSSNNNRADEYLSQLQADPNALAQMDDVAKKYNTAVEYIRRKDYDLAKIQLKRLLGQNPGMIQARSLLALLYLHDKKPKSAKRELNLAARIDVGNPTINTYFQEVKEMTGHSDAKEVLVNEKVPEEKQGITYLMDYSRVSFINILIGLLAGLLISVFLIFPAIRQKNNETNITKLLHSNEDVIASQSDVAAMQKTIDGLNEQLAKYTGQPDIKNSYENLIKAYTAVVSEDMETASSVFGSISRELLDDSGKSLYDSLKTTVENYALEDNYSEANELKENEDYVAASTLYVQIIEANEGYDGGKALMRLASCYEHLENIEDALLYYNKVTELFPDSEIATDAKEKISELTDR